MNASTEKALENYLQQSAKLISQFSEMMELLQQAKPLLQLEIEEKIEEKKTKKFFKLTKEEFEEYMKLRTGLHLNGD